MITVKNEITPAQKKILNFLRDNLEKFPLVNYKDTVHANVKLNDISYSLTKSEEGLEIDVKHNHIFNCLLLNINNNNNDTISIDYSTKSLEALQNLVENIQEIISLTNDIFNEKIAEFKIIEIQKQESIRKGNKIIEQIANKL